LDQKQNIPIQIFELKTNKNKHSIEFGTKQLKECRSILKNNNIPAYLVFPKNETPYFEVIDIDNKDEFSNIFNYQGHCNKSRFEAAKSIKENKEKVIDRFKITSWIIGIIVFLLCVLSKTGLFSINPEDITMLVISIGLFLIPFANKIRILGIEFERMTNNKDK